MLITSHLLSDIEDVCDRVIILYGGKIRATGSLNELLTVSDANRITTPELKPEVMTRLMQLLRENLSENEFKIDHPRRTLEEFFLDVIATAKRDSIETAGVVSGGEIADFLTSDDKNAVLEQLTVDVSKPAAPAEQTKVEAAPVRDVNAELEKLTGEVKAAEEPAPAAEEKKEDLSAADARLNDILGAVEKEK